MNYLFIHHSGVSGENNLDNIRADHKKKYSRTFYNIIIDKGVTYQEHDKWNPRGWFKRSKDIMVTGDYTRETLFVRDLRALEVQIKKYKENIKNVLKTQYIL